MKNDRTFIARNIWLSYRLLGTSGQSLRGLMAEKVFGRQYKLPRHSFTALKGIGFEAYENDRIALIGANGAGKTSLLKVISGIYAPDCGEVWCDGTVMPLLGGLPGISPDATGYENIRLSAYSMGVARSDIQDVIADVRAFSELDDFLHMPLRTYSSGMSARLLFSIVTALKADIFVLDEFAFASGDMFFVEKAKKRARDLVNSAKTVLIASHDDRLLRDICNKGVYLRNGELVAFGDVNEVLDEYSRERA